MVHNINTYEKTKVAVGKSIRQFNTGIDNTPNTYPCLSSPIEREKLQYTETQLPDISGADIICIYGPPRTGKTTLIKKLKSIYMIKNPSTEYITMDARALGSKPKILKKIKERYVIFLEMPNNAVINDLNSTIKIISISIDIPYEIAMAMYYVSILNGQPTTNANKLMARPPTDGIQYSPPITEPLVNSLYFKSITR
jgi:AAA15 family ATPase/GTPase